MARSSSPLPFRHSNSLPRTPSLARRSVHYEDIDELAGDTIPCSPAAFLRDRDTNITQPTQILSKPSLGAIRSSSPASSVIEVPASSPFQPPRKTAPLGTRLAPAGTVFRPPARPQPTIMKRPAPEPISLISDDEDDLTPPRGDIRPTTFKAQISAFAYKPEEDERKTREKLRQIWDVFGDRVPSNKAREALRACKNDIEDAIVLLERQQSQPKAKPQSASRPKAGRRLVSKGALRSAPASNRSFTRERSRSVSPSPPKPRRRLVQGRRHPSYSSSQDPSPDSLPEPPSSDDPLVIDLIDLVDDKEDDYEAERSPTPDAAGDDRVLACINTSTLQELAAMTSMKEAQLELMIQKRPFDDLMKARRVTVSKKPGTRKAAKISIGESVVDAVEVFLNAVRAIDEVVAKCETDAKSVKDQVETWDLDTFGHDKRRKRESSVEDGLPPTPTSLTSSRLIRPPIPRQPELMDGHCEMKPFQLFGLNWMSLLYEFNIGCILADEMGLGKTCQVISFISHLVESFEKHQTGERPWPNLVVVPPSTYKNWLAEFERFAPGLCVMGYRGSQPERAEIAFHVRSMPEAYHVVLATYSQINSEDDIENMQSFDLNAAIFDEGHKMKNPETKIYKDLRRIRASWKMLLTGMVAFHPQQARSLIYFRNPRSKQSAGDDIPA